MFSDCFGSPCRRLTARQRRPMLDRCQGVAHGRRICLQGRRVEGRRGPHRRRQRCRCRGLSPGGQTISPTATCACTRAGPACEGVMLPKVEDVIGPDRTHQGQRFDRARCNRVSVAWLRIQARDRRMRDRPADAAAALSPSSSAKAASSSPLSRLTRRARTEGRETWTRSTSSSATRPGRGIRYPDTAQERRAPGASAPLRGHPHRAMSTRTTTRANRSTRSSQLHRGPGDPPDGGQAKKGMGAGRPTLMNSQVGFQDVAGRVTRYTLRRLEKSPPSPHRDITLTKRWMDAIGIDVVCLFPTPMLQSRPPSASRGRGGDRRAPITAGCATPSSPRSRASDRCSICRSTTPRPTYKMVKDFGDAQRRGRVHGDVGALQAGLRQRLHEDLRALGGNGAAALVPCRL